MDKEVVTHTHPNPAVEYYSVIKKNKILPFEAARMDSEGIMLISEISQTRKTNTVSYHLYVKSKK